MASNSSWARSQFWSLATETHHSSTTNSGPMCSQSSTSRIQRSLRAVLLESTGTRFTSSWRRIRRLKWLCSVHLIRDLRPERSERMNLIVYSVCTMKIMWLVMGLSYSPKVVKIQSAKIVNHSMISHHVQCLKNFSSRSTA